MIQFRDLLGIHRSRTVDVSVGTSHLGLIISFHLFVPSIKRAENNMSLVIKIAEKLSALNVAIS